MTVYNVRRLNQHTHPYLFLALSLLVALGLDYLAVSLLASSPYGVYPVQALAWGALILLPLTLALSLMFRRMWPS